jgi:hypothetical protein
MEILIDYDVGYDHCKSLGYLLDCIHGNLDCGGGLGVVKLVFLVVVDNHLARVYHIRPFDNLSQDEIHSDHVLSQLLDDRHAPTFHLCHSLESVFSAMVRQLIERCDCSFVALIFPNLNGYQ